MSTAVKVYRLSYLLSLKSETLSVVRRELTVIPNKLVSPFGIFRARNLLPSHVALSSVNPSLLYDIAIGCLLPSWHDSVNASGSMVLKGALVSMAVDRFSSPSTYPSSCVNQYDACVGSLSNTNPSLDRRPVVFQRSSMAHDTHL